MSLAHFDFKQATFDDIVALLHRCGIFLSEHDISIVRRNKWFRYLSRADNLSVQYLIGHYDPDAIDGEEYGTTVCMVWIGKDGQLHADFHGYPCRFCSTEEQLTEYFKNLPVEQG